MGFFLGVNMMKEKIKDYTMINVGVLLVSSGMYFFLMPNNLATGGANGLAIVINHFIPGLSVGLMMVFINIILFIVAFLVIGKSFGLKTIYASYAVSLLVILLEYVMPLQEPLTDDIMVELIIGILITGAGMGLVFNQNASTGGTDISAKILNKFFSIDLGKGVLISDVLIALSASFAFGLKLSMYALIGILINSFVIDYIIEGFNVKKEVTLISEEYTEIKEFITKELGRGLTIYYGEGGYTGAKRDIMLVILTRREFIKLRRYVNTIDQDVFLSVKNTHGVYGLGFNEL